MRKPSPQGPVKEKWLRPRVLRRGIGGMEYWIGTGRLQALGD